MHNQNDPNCECVDCIKSMQATIDKLTWLVRRWSARVAQHEQHVAEQHAAFMRSRAQVNGRLQ
jgi:hypothetical protein